MPDEQSLVFDVGACRESFGDAIGGHGHLDGVVEDPARVEGHGYGDGGEHRDRREAPPGQHTGGRTTPGHVDRWPDHPENLNPTSEPQNTRVKIMSSTTMKMKLNLMARPVAVPTPSGPPRA